MSRTGREQKEKQRHQSSNERDRVSRIVIPSSVTVIRSDRFQEFTSLIDVQFASNGRLRTIDGFKYYTSLCRISIPAYVEFIGDDGFYECKSLKEVLFASDSHLNRISGFHCCTSLYRISIPASVEIINSNGFYGGKSLNEVLFASDSRLREIDSFMCCISLYRISIPASVEIIDGFNQCTSLHEAAIQPRCRIRRITGFQRDDMSRRTFLAYLDDIQLKETRRRLHLQIEAQRSLNS
jgi:hypothetical protein